MWYQNYSTEQQFNTPDIQDLSERFAASLGLAKFVVADAIPMVRIEVSWLKGLGTLLVKRWGHSGQGFLLSITYYTYITHNISW